MSAPPTPTRAAKILVVCSGNICRSPFAEGYLRMRLGQRQVADVEVGSGGTLGIVGEPASDETIALAREAGFDLAAHRSRGLARADVDAAGIILVMERSHRLELSVGRPAKAGAIRLVREFDPDVATGPRASDIFDPIGRPITEYRKCFRQITVSLDAFLDLWLASDVRAAGRP